MAYKRGVHSEQSQNEQEKEVQYEQKIPALKPTPDVPQEVLEEAEAQREMGYPKLADNIIIRWKAMWVLENHDLETLKANKVWIPNWRNTQEKYGNT
jgi:hypothetical protein